MAVGPKEEKKIGKRSIKKRKKRNQRENNKDKRMKGEKNTDARPDCRNKDRSRREG